ncbi:DNA polymerase III subunit alpha [Snodgrassella sp. CFCC 13594]|uniref:DNA polymerase III subunit alpha n=1 Tax=Snodgrassella sp. CFCC 13594 TaxID=1775559 RepID=UPI00082EEBC7|nr:DNA polymerase III subunit alpha [Snodgrassella sp. CFCC 13594]
MSEHLPYIPLRLHTEFSIEDGIVRIKDAVKRAAALGVPALGISDLMNVFGMVKFYKACRHAGVKPIMGADVWLENPRQPEKPFRLLLLIKNHAGYLRLNDLLTDAYVSDNKDPNRALIKQAWLAEGDNRGLICLSGAQYGEIGQAILNHKQAEAAVALHKYRQWFGDGFYLELQRLPEKPEWENVVTASVALAAEYQVPVVATHPTQFMDVDDFQAHEARVCIASGYVLADKRRPREFTPSQFFATPAIMAERFADIPEALHNSVAIAQSCNLTLTLGQHFLPVFPTPEGMNLDDYLVHLANEGLVERMKVLYPDEVERTAKLPEYQERMDYELGVIIQMQFPGYFLIVQDFINWAKQNGCPVGPGRGSGAGSVVAFALRITDLDPLRYNLLFERFLNPERVSMPDFDVDFCQENRGRVIQYVRHKYGMAAVSQIVTFGTMSSKSVVRDVGRVLDLPFGLCDRLSKLVPVEANKPLSLTKAMEAEPQIMQLLHDEEAEELMTLALKLEDLTRGLGMHAGGVIMAPGKIADFCPVYQAHGDDTSPVSMFDKDDVEQIGLVKFDFLGLRNLTIIELAQNYIETTTQQKIDVAYIPLDDAATYGDIFAKGNTTAVFQFESVGMKKMLIAAEPSKFEEIIAFVALYRPGPMDLIPDFTRRLRGEKFEYLHPLLEPVLSSTYGVMVYQEQVMQAAQVCGGYTLGGADLLRRAMGKKKVEEMVKHRAIFVAGAAKKGIDEAKANEIFDYMEKFAGYGFNKSHAAAYALVAYQTAWLKRHYLAEFMAATMSSELDNTDQLKVFVDDCVANGITFLPPSVNHSFYRFTPNNQMQIRYALGAIKGTGEAAVDAIVAAREAGGPFLDLFDFCQRVDKHHINRRTIEALVRAGAFDEMEPNRAMLLANIGLAVDNAEQISANANQGGLFDFAVDAIAPVEMIYVRPWSPSVKLAEEKQALGFYFSGHPFAPYADEVRAFASTTLANLKAAERRQWVAGFVTSVRYIMGKRGKFAVVVLEDGSARQEVVVAGQVLEEHAAFIKADEVLLLECKVAVDEYNGGDGLRITADVVYTLDQARERFARSLKLTLWPENEVGPLLALLQQHREGAGKVPLKLAYENHYAQGVLDPGREWQVCVSQALMVSLSQLLGEEAVHVGW